MVAILRKAARVLTSHSGVAKGMQSRGMAGGHGK